MIMIMIIIMMIIWTMFVIIGVIIFILLSKNLIHSYSYINIYFPSFETVLRNEVPLVASCIVS